MQHLSGQQVAASSLSGATARPHLKRVLALAPEALLLQFTRVQGDTKTAQV
jgi:hypothetical protein